MHRCRHRVDARSDPEWCRRTRRWSGVGPSRARDRHRAFSRMRPARRGSTRRPAALLPRSAAACPWAACDAARAPLPPFPNFGSPRRPRLARSTVRGFTPICAVPWHWKQYCLNTSDGFGDGSSAPRRLPATRPATSAQRTEHERSLAPVDPFCQFSSARRLHRDVVLFYAATGPVSMPVARGPTWRWGSGRPGSG